MSHSRHHGLSKNKGDAVIRETRPMKAIRNIVLAFTLTLIGATSMPHPSVAQAQATSPTTTGDFTAAMTFEMASTNLVVELALIMLVFLGWQFTLAEFVGAPIMVALLIVLFRSFLNRKMLHEAREQADKGLTQCLRPG
jgi:hypothetical protein